MPLTRCWNYNADGSAINGGCTRQGVCAFVHPSEPNWDRARPSTRTQDSGYRGRGRGFKRGGSSTHFGVVPRNSLESNLDPWGSSSTATPAIDKKVYETSTTDQWGNSRNEEPSSGQAESSTNANTWGSVNIESGEDKGWSGNEWRKDNSKSKGGAFSVSESAHNSSNGGEEDNGWGGNIGWGNSDEQPSSNDNNDSWGANEVKERPSLEVLQQDQPPVLEKPKAKPPPDISPVEALKHWSHISIAGSLKYPTSPPPSKEQILEPKQQATEPLNRTQVYSQVIIRMQNAVTLQLQLDKAHADVERWKRTQSSSQYARASPATRKKLNDIRSDLVLKVADLTKRVKQSIRALAELPDIAPPLKEPISSNLNEQRLVKYTNELKTWIQDLHLHRRVIPPEIVQENRISSVEELPQMKDSNLKMELDENPLKTVSDLKLAVIALEQRIDRAAEHLYAKTFTHLTDMDQKILTRLDGEEARESKNLSTTMDQRVTTLSNQANNVGEQLGKQADSAAILIKNIHEMERKITLLRVEVEEQRAIRAQVETDLAQIQQNLAEDIEHNKQLSEQIEKLHLRRSLPSLSAEIDAIKPIIRGTVQKHIEEVVIPVLEGYRKAVQQNNEMFTHEVYRKLQPVLDTTEVICRNAQAEMKAQTPLT